ncbi:MAG: uracil-DNA glycosylase [Desulfovibrionales bacterium]
MARAELLEHLAREIRQCTRCPLYRSRTNAVPGEGPSDARIILVGEGPGQLEDEQGRPFVGRTGEFFTTALCKAGFQRSDLLITSAVKCRPPGNRFPSKSELTVCRDSWLSPQMDCIRPELVVLLGRAPMLQIFGNLGKMSEIHGTVRTKNGRTYFLTYHPSAAMRFPWAGEALRSDLKKIGQRIS